MVLAQDLSVHFIIQVPVAIDGYLPMTNLDETVGLSQAAGAAHSFGRTSNVQRMNSGITTMDR